ncbi:MAG TPA: radical SAM protein [Ignavibacteriaceae bacterium]|nr:radical SAM protein [Ignavibacteriaceae bacterium]
MLLLCNYYLTYRCNAFCEFCHFGVHENFKDTPYAKLEDFKSNVSQLADLGVKFIDLTGGEPLLHKEIHLMAEYAKSLKMQTSITSNGLLYPKFAEKLAGNVDLLHFSLDSPDEEEHNKIRKVDCFNHVFKSINIAKSLGEFPDLLFTVTNETYKKLPRMHEIAQKNELMLLVNPVFSYFGNPGLNEEAIKYIEEYCSGKKELYLNKGFMKLRRDGGNDINDPACKAVSRVVVISPYNEIILPCYHFEREKIPIDRPIKEIRSTEKIKYYKKMEGRFDFCQGCTVNCYFEPSFFFPTNFYSIASLSSKFKYGFNKLVKQKLNKKKLLKTEDT